MPDHDLHVFMQQQAADMASEYSRIFARATEDPGTAGDEGEQSWATLLKKWLPQNYHVETKGRLIGADGQMSPQIDIVILKPSYPPSARERKIWLADGVAAAFECKTTLTAAHIADAEVRGPKFKACMTERNGSPYKELRSPLVYGLLAHSHSWKEPKSTPVKNITDRLNSGAATAHRPKDLIDVVCVSDLTTISTLSSTRYDWKYTGNPSFHASLLGGTWGPTTSFMCAASDEEQLPHFQPVASLIAALWMRLAREDPELRPLARYYMRANMLGIASGAMKPWPQTVFSDLVRVRVDRGHSESDNWSEWATSFFG